ncbi:hypothetical protein [Dyadobacter sp. CY351]|uniref:hypothetical protein n=1 Tax=Dyadobacter sp. CY351 TaxID=2909337 RepID=UPI001F1C6845|nr:hypothetical protein [Dyadobacter sp. CY351]MCF2517140.1 hypothetical protein [Dyadobacter sp. CY351]
MSHKQPARIFIGNRFRKTIEVNSLPVEGELIKDKSLKKGTFYKVHNVELDEEELIFNLHCAVSE